MKTTFFIDQVLRAVAHCLPEKKEGYALHEPQFKGNEWAYVKECLDTGWVSSVGAFVDRFEKDLAEFTGAKHAIVTANGTAALHMALLLVGVQAGDEVLTPALTFVATANAISYCGAISHFVDSEPQSLGVDAQKLDGYLKDIAVIKNGVCYNSLTQRPIRALCVMHTFGHPVDLDAIREVSDRYHLALVEDAAEAVGSYYKGQHVGSYGLVGTLSFNGNKIATTGGGGALLTNDEALAKRAKHLTTTAKIAHAWHFCHDEVGYNYRLPNINAALGCAQLEQMVDFLASKRRLAIQYQKAFVEVDGLNFIVEPHYAKSNYWLNAMLLDKVHAAERDVVLTVLNQRKIGVRPVWELMHQLSMYCSMPRMDLSCAEDLASRLINLPSSACIIAGQM